MVMRDDGRAGVLKSAVRKRPRANLGFLVLN